MPIAITGKNFVVPEDVRAYVLEKLGKLMRVYRRIERITVTLTEKASKTKAKANKIEIVLHIPGADLRGEEAGESFRAAVDAVIEKLIQQLKKAKGRLLDKQQQNHQKVSESAVLAARSGNGRGAGSSARAAGSGRSATTGDQPLVFVEKFSLKPMSTRDALAQLKHAKRDFYLFFNGSGNINCVYKRSDGNFGLVVPESELSE